eukprot:CAMPEP_0204211034 /NCGR_PEP_ID=MMETSP0361-20130328/74346_1 /ASSEMBLY_ACC=CAM_ASM_000343 /TAXON_ID=268821 /ORGANISM="Scrippsiella Hangoei, Strain SHTV-5" /LENGTH=50 /DNA_ID=CAMNT_0051175247 /DNA_START=67 /DNA_END=216 /DNA_ORIENTATION=-
MQREAPLEFPDELMQSAALQAQAIEAAQGSEAGRGQRRQELGTRGGRLER